MNRPSKESPPNVYADDVAGAHLTFDKRKTLMEMVIANPDGPAPIPKYKTARENLEHVVHDAGGVFGGNGGLANPQGGMSDAVDPRNCSSLTIDGGRGAGFRESIYTGAIGRAQEIASPGDRVCQHQHRARLARDGSGSADSTGSKDVTFTKIDGAGHLDVLCGTKSETIVFAPVSDWTKRHQK